MIYGVDIILKSAWHEFQLCVLTSFSTRECKAIHKGNPAFYQYSLRVFFTTPVNYFAFHKHANSEVQ